MQKNSSNTFPDKEPDILETSIEASLLYTEGGKCHPFSYLKNQITRSKNGNYNFITELIKNYNQFSIIMGSNEVIEQDLIKFLDGDDNIDFNSINSFLIFTIEVLKIRNIQVQKIQLIGNDNLSEIGKDETKPIKLKNKTESIKLKNIVEGEKSDIPLVLEIKTTIDKLLLIAKSGSITGSGRPLITIDQNEKIDDKTKKIIYSMFDIKTPINKGILQDFLKELSIQEKISALEIIFKSIYPDKDITELPSITDIFPHIGKGNKGIQFGSSITNSYFKEILNSSNNGELPHNFLLNSLAEIIGPLKFLCIKKQIDENYNNRCYNLIQYIPHEVLEKALEELGEEYIKIRNVEDLANLLIEISSKNNEKAKVFLKNIFSIISRQEATKMKYSNIDDFLEKYIPNKCFKSSISVIFNSKTSNSFDKNKALDIALAIVYLHQLREMSDQILCDDSDGSCDIERCITKIEKEKIEALTTKEKIAKNHNLEFTDNLFDDSSELIDLIENVNFSQDDIKEDIELYQRLYEELEEHDKKYLEKKVCIKSIEDIDTYISAEYGKSIEARKRTIELINLINRPDELNLSSLKDIEEELLHLSLLLSGENNEKINKKIPDNKHCLQSYIHLRLKYATTFLKKRNLNMELIDNCIIQVQNYKKIDLISLVDKVRDSIEKLFKQFDSDSKIYFVKTALGNDYMKSGEINMDKIQKTLGINIGKSEKQRKRITSFIQSTQKRLGDQNINILIKLYVKRIQDKAN